MAARTIEGRRGSKWGAAERGGVLLAVFSFLSAGSASARTQDLVRRDLEIVPLSADQRLEHAFDPARSAGTFVGISAFEGAEDHPEEVPFAADDAVDLCALFVLDLQLIHPGQARLALSGEPRKDSSRRRLGELLAAGVQRTDAKRITLLDEFTDLAERAGPEGILVLGVATHGYAKDGLPSLLTQDSSKKHLDITAMPVAAIEEIVEAIEKRRHETP